MGYIDKVKQKKHYTLKQAIACISCFVLKITVKNIRIFGSARIVRISVTSRCRASARNAQYK